MLTGKRILLIIGGGISAYKSLDLIRKLSERGAAVTPVLTGAATEFVTPLSVAALSGSKVYGKLFFFKFHTRDFRRRPTRQNDAL